MPTRRIMQIFSYWLIASNEVLSGTYPRRCMHAKVLKNHFVIAYYDITWIHKTEKKQKLICRNRYERVAEHFWLYSISLYLTFSQIFPITQLPHPARVTCFINNLWVIAEGRSNHQRCSVKKVFLKISQNSWENACTRVSFLIKVAGQENLAQVFSSEFCEIFKNTIFIEQLRTAASKKALGISP